MKVEYRIAEMSDLKRIIAFVDFWLTGGGLPDGVPGCGHDFFVPGGRQKAYIEKYLVLLAIYEGEIVGWAVKTKKGVLIHLLVAGTFRGNGIGGEMLRRMNPDTVRSKFDQSTGDPSGFYHKHGYIKASSERLGKKKNIELFAKNKDLSLAAAKSGENGESVFHRSVNHSRSGYTSILRTIDVMAEKLDLGDFHPVRF